MERHYPRLFNQNDYGAVDLGTSSTETIAAGGCMDCSFAMKACLYGHDTDPLQMNKLFIEKSVYVQTDLLPDNALALVFPDIKYLSTINYEPVPTDLNHIKQLLDDPSVTLTVRINFGGGNYHFVEAVACDGSVLHIANSISGAVEDFSQRYGNPVTANLHVLIYTGPIPPQMTIPVDTAQPSALTTRFNQAITKSNNFDKIADLLGISSDQRVTSEAGQLAVDKYKYLLQEVQQLQSKGDATQPVVAPVEVVAPVTPLSPTTAPTPASIASDAIAATLAAKPSMPTFSDGKPAVFSRDANVLLVPANTTKATPTLSSKASIWEFIKALVRTIFL